MPVGIVESAMVIALAKTAHSRNQKRKRRIQRRKFFSTQSEAMNLAKQAAANSFNDNP